uniref:Uncharacterized protein n=1 Tax=Myotis myotis TaxID=51298 RepID=A0A7J7R982_MYOMY|nr:hypothetical protein mMyoMyo1_010862 [Myotis myotis]
MGSNSRRRKGHKACEDGGRDEDDAATTQGAPGATGRRKRPPRALPQLRRVMASIPGCNCYGPGRCGSVGWSVVLYPERSQVQFQVRAHT